MTSRHLDFAIIYACNPKRHRLVDVPRQNQEKKIVVIIKNAAAVYSEFKLNLWIHKIPSHTRTRAIYISCRNFAKSKIQGKCNNFKNLSRDEWTNLPIVFKMHKWFCHSTFTSSSRTYNGWIFYIFLHTHLCLLCNEIVLPCPQSSSHRVWVSVESEKDGFN